LVVEEPEKHIGDVQEIVEVVVMVVRLNVIM
jgi:hypothetical protein